jgi:flagellar motor switch protein FliN/FliY
MAADLRSILSLEIPLIVRLAERPIALADVLSLAPGAILELPKTSEEELDVLVNNRLIGRGHAVKIGENFGIGITEIHNAAHRVAAIANRSGAERAPHPDERRPDDTDDADAG